VESVEVVQRKQAHKHRHYLALYGVGWFGNKDMKKEKDRGRKKRKGTLLNYVITY